MSLRLIGFRHSIYCWSVRLALAELGREVAWEEVNPFDDPVPDHPFNRVPVLWDGDFRVYETGAILEWLFPPVTDRKAAIRARHVAGIADGYAYRPLVRQVYAHGVFRPALGMEGDADVIADGMKSAEPVLAALEEIVEEGLVLTSPGASLTAADCHIAPMVAAFAAWPAGHSALEDHPALSRWFSAVAERPSWAETKPKHMGEHA